MLFLSVNNVRFIHLRHKFATTMARKTLSASRNWVLGAGCWPLTGGCWLLAAGCWLLAAPYEYPMHHPLTSPSTNFKSTLRTLRILKVRNFYLQNSQGQKLTLGMDSDLTKISNFVFVIFMNRKILLICLLLNIHVYGVLSMVSTLWSIQMLTRMIW